MWNFSKIADKWLKPVFLNGVFRRFIIAIAAYSTTLAFAVNPVPAHLGRIAMCLQPTQGNAGAVNSPVIYNPFKVYGNHILYSIHPEHEIIVIRVPNTGELYRISLIKVIEEAMKEWSTAIPGLTWGKVSYYGGNKKKWYFDLDEDHPSKYRTANALRYVVGGSINPTITFFSKGFGSLTTPDVYNVLSAKMADPTMRKYLEFILRYTAKHEIGHLLGFEHTPNPNMENPEDTEECSSVVWLDNMPNVTAGPPLMIETLTEYFDIMRNHHDVPLIIEHINIAPQEAAFARAMFNVDCPVTPQAVNNRGDYNPTDNNQTDNNHTDLKSNASSSKSSTCPRPIKVISKGQAAALSLLLE